MFYSFEFILLRDDHVVFSSAANFIMHDEADAKGNVQLFSTYYAYQLIVTIVELDSEQCGIRRLWKTW